MKEPGLDGRHRDKTPAESGRDSTETKRHLESELEQANSTVPFRRYSRKDARRNGQGE